MTMLAARAAVLQCIIGVRCVCGSRSSRPIFTCSGLHVLGKSVIVAATATRRRRQFLDYTAKFYRLTGLMMARNAHFRPLWQQSVCRGIYQ